MGKMAKKKPATKATKPRFEQVLALHQVLLSLFGVSQFSELAEHCGRSRWKASTTTTSIACTMPSGSTCPKTGDRNSPTRTC